MKRNALSVFAALTVLFVLLSVCACEKESDENLGEANIDFPQISRIIVSQEGGEEYEGIIGNKKDVIWLAKELSGRYNVTRNTEDDDATETALSESYIDVSFIDKHNGGFQRVGSCQILDEKRIAFDGLADFNTDIFIEFSEDDSPACHDLCWICEKKTGKIDLKKLKKILKRNSHYTMPQ